MSSTHERIRQPRSYPVSLRGVLRTRVSVYVRWLPIVTVLLFGAAACGRTDLVTGPSDLGQTRTFTVRIDNVSAPGAIASSRLGGVVPLSPGVFAVYRNGNPLFTVGAAADQGTERIAEDGDNRAEGAALGQVAGLQNGSFASPGGADGMPTLGPGEFVTFTITATPGDRVNFETMFAQSNDWFYSFGGSGLALFNGETPVSGDMTAQVVLYDAGTEEDTPPGEGPDQAPVQAAPNTGPSDDNTSIRIPSGFTIPPVTSIIRVTVTPQ